MGKRVEFNVGRGIRVLLKKNGMTQGDLMRETGMERSYISRLASGRFNNIMLPTAMALARAFDISVEEFAAECLSVERPPERKPNQKRKTAGSRLA